MVHGRLELNLILRCEGGRLQTDLFPLNIWLYNKDIKFTKEFKLGFFYPLLIVHIKEHIQKNIGYLQ